MLQLLKPHGEAMGGWLARTEAPGLLKTPSLSDIEDLTARTTTAQHLGQYCFSF